MPAKLSGGWIPTVFMSAYFVAAIQIAKSSSAPNTRIVFLPSRRRTVRILREFVWGHHDILFYVKSSPASRIYLGWRRKWNDNRITIANVEITQSDLRNEPTVAREAVHLWERTVLRCDSLFSNSESVKRSLQREYNLKSEIVPTGVDTKFFTPAWERPADAPSPGAVRGIVAPVQTAATVTGCGRPVSPGGFCHCG